MFGSDTITKQDVEAFTYLLVSIEQQLRQKCGKKTRSY